MRAVADWREKTDYAAEVLVCERERGLGIAYKTGSHVVDCEPTRELVLRGHGTRALARGTYEIVHNGLCAAHARDQE